MQKKAFTLFADYHQFYLWDEKIAPDVPTDWTEDDVKRRIKAAPHIAVICPVRNMTVPVEVEIHDTEPSYDASKWDHIAECSIDLPSGGLDIQECTGGSIAIFQIKPGIYRVRAFYGALDSLDESGLEGNDHYTVVLWPAPHQEVVVVKKWVEDRLG